MTCDVTDFIPDRERAADAGATIPVIDISPFTGDDAVQRWRVVDAVKQACEHVGFFVIIGHGIDDAVVRAVFDSGRAFFARPRDQKMCIKRPGPGISRGYNGLAGQSLSLSMGNRSPPDLMESLGFGPFATNDDPYWTQGYGPVHGHPNLFPEDMPQLQRAVADYWQSMEELSGRINRIFALALGLDEDFFVVRSARHVTSMRVNYYPAQDRPPEPGQLRAGAHSDYGAFTILCGESAPGSLQVLRRGGDWVYVPMIKDSFVINIGDLLMRWTNDEWVSTIHRVANPPEDLRDKVDRMSVAFFFVPDHDVEVKCIDRCTGPDNPPRYPAVTAGAHWRGKILAAREITAQAN